MIHYAMYLAAAVLLALGTATTASAAKSRAKAYQWPVQQRDCTPFNGRYGYYGNPWCDTGSYRMEDIEFRERYARYRKPVRDRYWID